MIIVFPRGKNAVNTCVDVCVKVYGCNDVIYLNFSNIAHVSCIRFSYPKITFI